MTYAGYLADTNVVSEFARTDGKPDARVERWLEAIDPSLLFTSTLVLGEIQKGIELLGPGRRRSHLEHWLSWDLESWFGSRVISIDRAVAIRWGSLTILAKSAGIQLPVIDGLIAATALEHGLTLVTRNVRDFEGTGVTILNPWT